MRIQLLVALFAIASTTFAMEPMTNLVPVETGTSGGIHEKYWVDSPVAKYQENAVYIQAGPYAGSGAIIQLEDGNGTFGITN